MNTYALATIAGLDPGMFFFVAFIVLVALAFDYINGFHDAANSIATIVSTRVLTPGQAVVWAAFFNFIAFLVLGEAVAGAIGKGLVDVEKIKQVGEAAGMGNTFALWVILCGLIGAIAWNLITWFYGIPSSSSHALIGGFAGSAITACGFSVLVPSGWTGKWAVTLYFIILSPLIGMLLGFVIMVVTLWAVRNMAPGRVDGYFRKGQLLSSALFSLGHGGNDAQKTMGIILTVLIAVNVYAKDAEKHVPLWVVLACHAAIGLGTLSGGWRIVKTMGSKITKLKPIGGFAAETAAAAAIIGVTFAGIPVSTTHTITGAIVGVGATRRLSSVKWGVAGTIVWAWILTIPAAALIAAVSFLICRIFL